MSGNKKINQQTVDELKKLVEELEKKIKEQKDLYDLNLKDYGSIVNYRKEIFGEDGKPGIRSQIIEVQNKANEIKQRIDTFDLFWNGDGENSSFDYCKTEILSIYNKVAELSAKISDSETSLGNQNNTINSFVTTYKNTLNEKLKEVEIIKKDLQDYRDQVVGGSLFKGYQKSADDAKASSKSYSITSIIFLSIAAIILGCMMLKEETKNAHIMLSSSISFILLTASFVCSGKSKVAHKSFEEYLHKATLLQSFVGYREQYKQTLDDEEYSQFFREVIEAIKVNASDKSDEYLKFKWPWQKVVDGVSSGVKDACKVVTSSIQKKEDGGE